MSKARIKYATRAGCVGESQRGNVMINHVVIGKETSKRRSNCRGYLIMSASISDCIVAQESFKDEITV